MPRSDLVLFLTSADRPFTESEREFMAEIREWGKKIVIIVNKVDLLRPTSRSTQVTPFVEDNIAAAASGSSRRSSRSPPCWRSRPRPWGIATRAERERLWQLSRFGALEKYVFETLDEEGRIRLKLLNPLGVAERSPSGTPSTPKTGSTVLRDDLATISNIERQLERLHSDMRRQFTYSPTRVENIILR